MKKRQLDSLEIKEHLMEILLAFDACCKTHHLRFSLAGGTLLGAVRHKGFIPWDDDIDICIPRPDYEQLMQLNRTEQIFPPHMKLVCFEEGTLSYPFMKLLDLRVQVERDYLAEDEADYLWIDIFPVDGLPSDSAKIEKIYRRAAFLRKLFMLAKVREGTGKSRAKRIAKAFVVPFVKRMGNAGFAKKLVALARQHAYEDCKDVGAVTWGLYGTGERLEKSAYEKSVEIRFEGYPMPVMSCYDSYLTNLFGDYMTPPPEKDRESHDMKVWLCEDA